MAEAEANKQLANDTAEALLNAIKDAAPGGPLDELKFVALMTRAVSLIR